ncbi:hypothetical protein [Blastococcus sp. TBT05-19]|uniref:hypothetical protein n=1 Tax=Blastococcus sp. TBT05-19 TaxID=2250581 RepID=UPI0011BE83D5|nr:hypothetical protein [Blastococcus sp. TBT05-19]
MHVRAADGMRRRRVYGLLYGGCAVFGAAFGVAWWAYYGDAVLGGFFLGLAALSVLSYYLVTQPMRLRAKRDAEREATAAVELEPASSADSADSQVKATGYAPPGLGPASGEIIVERPKGYYVAVYRRYRILIDGRKVGAVKRGETLRTTVTAGPHTVAARIDWSGSPAVEVNVPPGGQVALDVEPSNDPFAGMLSSDKMLTLRLKP